MVAQTLVTDGGPFVLQLDLLVIGQTGQVDDLPRLCESIQLGQQRADGFIDPGRPARCAGDDGPRSAGISKKKTAKTCFRTDRQSKEILMSALKELRNIQQKQKSMICLVLDLDPKRMPGDCRAMAGRCCRTCMGITRLRIFAIE